MNLNKWGRSLTAVALVGALAACDEGLTEVNENPNSPEEVPVSTVLASGIWDLVSNNAGRGTHGEWTTLYHVYNWGGHMAQAAYNDETNYTPRSGINQNIWAEMYSGALQDLIAAQDQAEELGDQNLVAVTDILLVYGFLFLADMFGDVPYAQALNLEEFPQPEFSTQQEIYPDLLRRLEAAAGQINVAGNTSAWASGDLIYGGNLDRWQEFANSLRLRIAMRISGTTAAASARTEFAEAWAGNRFDSVADQAAVNWTGSLPSQNPAYEVMVLGGRDDFRVSETLEDRLSARNDPRLAIFAQPAADGTYRGLTAGDLPADLGLTVADFSRLGTAFIAPDAPSLMMRYSEVLFLGAEAALKGWIAGGATTARSLCEQGVRASMEENGVSAAAAAAYLAANPCVTESDILWEKWVALFQVSQEAWNEVRRRPDVLVLPLPTNAVINRVPARMPYPENEALYNPNFADYAGVTITQKLWWMPS